MPFEPIEQPKKSVFEPVDDYQYTQPENGKAKVNIGGTDYTTQPEVAERFQAISGDDTFDPPTSGVLEQSAAEFDKSFAYMAYTAQIMGGLSAEDASSYIAERSAALKLAQERAPERVKQFQDEFSKQTGFFGYVSTVFKYPDVMGRQMVSSMAGSMVPILGTAAGTVAGLPAGPVGATVGGVAGASVFGAIQEIGAEMDQIASEMGYDTSKSEDLLKFLSDEKIQEAARVRAAKKGITQASFDAVTQAFGGRFIKSMQTATGKVGAAVGEVALQSASEGAGEATAQAVARGNVDVGDVILETFTAAGTSTAQVGIAAAGTGAFKTPKEARQELAAAAEESPAVAEVAAKVERGLEPTVLDQKKLTDELGPEAASDAIAAMRMAKEEIIDTAGVYSEVSEDGKTASSDIAGVGKISVSIETDKIQVSSLDIKDINQDSEAKIAKVIGDIVNAESKPVSSGDKISVYEAGVYEKAAQDGFDVVKNPKAVKDKDGFIVTPDGSPVYTVSQKPEMEFVPEPSAGPDAIKQAAELSKILSRKRPSRILRSAADVGAGIGRGAAFALQPISTRVGNISPKIKGALRKFEGNLSMRVQRDMEALEPYFQKVKKLSRRDKTILDFAMINGDVNTVNEIAKRNGFEKELKVIRKTLDAIYSRSQQVGLDVEYREDFFPRQVKNHKKFVEYFEKSEAGASISEALILKAEEAGKPLSFEEKAHLINTLLRGYKTAQITLAKPGALKERSIDFVTDEIFDFYAPMDQSLLNYIDSVNEAIEARRFFGKKDINKKDENITESIGAYVLRELQDGNITALQVQELSDILKSRFSKAIMNPALRFYKNFSYIDTMGSFTSTLTQIGDLVPVLYKAGLYRSFVSLGKAATGNVEITNKDLGINKISQEFQDGDLLSKTLDRVFAINQMKRITSLMQNTFVDATLQQHRAMSKKPTADYVQKLQYMFGDEAQSVIDDLKAGRNSDNVKLLLINDILDYQPIAKSEMPQLYLQSANSRIFYMLKSFTIKQLYDVYYRDVITPISEGKVVAGLSNLTRYAAFFVAMNASSDFLKNLLLGREPEELDDAVVTNILRLLGISKFVTYQARQEGVGTAAAKMVLPPFKFIDSLYKDMWSLAEGKKDVNDLKVIDSVPIAGKMYYWWFGGGADKKKEDDKKANF